MKILFSDITYSYLFPGGKINMVLLLKHNYELSGHSVFFENWWEGNLDYDVIHFFGFNDINRLLELKKRGVKLIYTHIIDELANSSNTLKFRYRMQRLLLKLLLPQTLLFRIFPHYAIDLFDRVVYINSSDFLAGQYIFGVKPAKCSIIGHGYHTANILKILPNEIYKDCLLCIGTIVPRKRQVELAKLAIKSKVRVVFAGHHYNDDYYNEFMSFVGEYVVYLGRIDDTLKNVLLNSCKGFVLLSRSESGCIAIYEASSFGLPIILPDLPWARSYEDARNLFFLNNLKDYRKFQNYVNGMKNSDSQSFKMDTWAQIAERYLEVYNG